MDHVRDSFLGGRLCTFCPSGPSRPSWEAAHGSGQRYWDNTATATATAAATAPIATNMTSPALTRVAGLWTAARCTSWIPGPLKLNEVQRVTYYYSFLTWCSLKFYDLSYNRWWLQKTNLCTFHLYTLDLSTHSFFHRARTAGFAGGWYPLSKDTSWRNKVIYTYKITLSRGQQSPLKLSKAEGQHGEATEEDSVSYADD